VTRVLGQAVQRVDAARKVSGRADYSADIHLDRLCHAVLLGSTVAHGRVRAIDTRAAESLPGVLGVFTHLNLPKFARQPVFDMTRVTGMSFAPLQDDAVLYAGQPIAMIVADTLEQAQVSAQTVHVDYEPEEAVGTLGDAEARGGVYDVETVMTVLPAHYRRGDAEAAFATATHLLEARYSQSAYRHHPIELTSTTAAWDGESLTLWETTQGVSMTQWNTADALGIEPKHIRVVSHFVGGSFGTKGSWWPHTALAAQVARLLERPLKLVLTRDQMGTMVGFREEQHQQITMATDDAGVLTGIRHIKTSATSPFDDFAEPSCNAAQMMYACPNVQTDYRLARINAMTPVFMRGVGQTSGGFAIECALDELAHQLGIDPVEIRLRNYAEVDPRSGAKWSSKSLRECYKAAAEKIGWHERNPQPRSMTEDGLLIGYGMASAAYPVNPRELTEVRIRLHSDGSALVQTGAQDLGTGTYTIVAQAVAEELGLEPQEVTVMLGDTAFPRAGNSTGAITSAAVGSAALLAARGLRQQLIDLAVSDPRSPLNGHSSEEVAFSAGILRSADGMTHDHVRDVLQRRMLNTLDGFGQWDPASGIGLTLGKISHVVRSDTSSWSFGAWFVKLSVDPELGLLRVQHMSGAWGAGRILNTKTARNQMQGGAVMGIGQALLEQTAIDRTSARLVNPGLAEYLIPTHADAPPRIDITFIHELDTEINPLGAKGIGELGVVGVTAAIANAVFHATGCRVRHLPIMPEDLL
jgi:xanthine dehydrogenase YagR molybdenum-binding subunit